MKQNRAFQLFMPLAAAVVFSFIFVFPGVRLSIFRELRKISAARAAEDIIAFCESYNVSRTKSSTIYFTDSDREYAIITEALINTYLPLIAVDFGLEEAPEVKLVIFSSEKEMHSAIGYSNAENKGKTPMGAYSAGIISVLSPSCWADGGETVIDSYISAGPVVHELAHLALDVKTKGNNPAWFSEGAALYYENKYTGAAQKAGESNVSYRELSDGFKYMDEKISYAKSYKILRFIDEKNGEKGLRHIYKQLEDGKSLDAVLRRELGGSFRELDAL